MKAIVFAIGSNGEFGNKGQLPWPHNPQDLKNFSDITKKLGCVVMGCNTYKSLPKKLKDRKNVVIVRPNTNYEEVVSQDGSTADIYIEDTSTGRFDTINKKLAMYSIHSYAVIGGVDLIKKAVKSNSVDKCFVTTISGSFECDKTFPVKDLQMTVEKVTLDKDAGLTVFEGKNPSFTSDNKNPYRLFNKEAAHKEFTEKFKGVDDDTK